MLHVLTQENKGDIWQQTEGVFYLPGSSLLANYFRANMHDGSFLLRSLLCKLVNTHMKTQKPGTNQGRKINLLGKSL